MKTTCTGARRVSDWVGFAVFCAWSLSYVGLIADSIHVIPGVAVFLLPSVLCELVIARSFLTRRPVQDRITGWLPRAVAHAGTFLLPIFFWIAGRWKSEWLQPTGDAAVGAGAALWLMGTVITLWTVWALRSAFSIEPQARELITAGPYRFVRHPIYLSYVLQFGGLWISHMTLPVTLAVGSWLALMMLRMRFEEQVLSRAFPEYRHYCRRTGRIAPRLAGMKESRPSPVTANARS